MNKIDINNLLIRINPKIKAITLKYNYNEYITNLLYLIIPAFIIKYEIKNENNILSYFNNIPIIINNINDTKVTAYYNREVDFKSNTIKRSIILNNYYDSSNIVLLDNLIHELNHAINSLNSEMIVDNDIHKLRCGLSIVNYKNTSIINKDNIVLEEVINVIQTEQILKIINDYLNYKTDDYQSNAYKLETSILRPLLLNRTFITTISNLRYKGYINEIDSWFDSITNIKNSFKTLSNYIDKIHFLQQSLTNNSIKNKLTISKIKKLIEEVNKIINLFNQSSIYK